MAKEDNILDRIREILGDSSTNFSILEHQVDVKVQMEYFEFAKENREEASVDDLSAVEDDLNNDNTTADFKRKLMVGLASLDQPEAYRVLERYSANAPSELKDFAIMATQESRMLLESHLLDEQQVFISTGLGGKGGKLRYFVVIFSENGEPFTLAQQKLLMGELDYSLKQSDAEIEKIEFRNDYIAVLALVPLPVQVRLPFKKAIDECNALGNFIQEAFIITNVKELTDSEIEDILRNPPSEIQEEGNTEDNDEE